MERQTDLTEVLAHIDPASLDYQEWVGVGMGLKEAGYPVSAWEAWSQRDGKRYHAGECARKWESFRGDTAAPITAGTIVQMALDRGWSPDRGGAGYELDWDDVIGGGHKDDLVVVNANWLEGRDVAEPQKWDAVEQLITYLETLFEAGENVGYVTKSYPNEGRHLPTGGCWDRTAGQLIEELRKCKGDIGAVLGDYSPEAGAWIRFNPLDGQGCKNANVTDWRYALVESDSMEIDRQNAILRELELPIACLVHSGGKSLHAIVRVDAGSYEEYRKRVDYLYTVCRKNGLEIDQQNRNPSRLSRMPGIMRKGHKQFLVDTNIGKGTWDEWREWIESVNDDLPDPESLASVWDALPELAPPLIDNVLRQGHKMLLAGPSKAGKSYSLIELCIAIAEGQDWLGFHCTRGKVLYVNLELDRASCLHRFRDVYEALGLRPDHLENIDIWNLRGRSVPMDKLAPRLIRRAAKKDFIAIVIDPIYKVITGDENSADQMAHFCNQFDKVCTELGCAVIYCHHHSKGSQGGKRSMDRASGSGVFARDPDALLDLIELDITDDLRKQQENDAVCKACALALEDGGHLDEVSQDDVCSARVMLDTCKRVLDAETYKATMRAVETARKAVTGRTAWRVEGTLREFPKFQPVNMWFDFPMHRIDKSGVLKDVQPDEERAPWQRAIAKRKPKETKEAERKRSVETAFEACNMGGDVTIVDIAEYLGTSEKTARRRLKEHGGFGVEDGKIKKR